MICQALDSLSCGGQLSVVSGRGDPVKDFLSVGSLIHIPQAGGTQLQFNVAAEHHHANTDVPQNK